MALALIMTAGYYHRCCDCGRHDYRGYGAHAFRDCRGEHGDSYGLKALVLFHSQSHGYEHAPAPQNDQGDGRHEQAVHGWGGRHFEIEADVVALKF